MTCHQYGNGLTVCTTGRTYVAIRKPVGIKWCFGCRAHLPHDWIVIDYVEPSYYEPMGRYDCSRCHRERVLGFGRVWEWE